MRKLVVYQTTFLLRQREAVASFLLLMWFVIGNYLGNVTTFRGMDVTQMYYPLKMMTLSYNRVNYNADITTLFIMLYPILVTLPAGFSYVKEQQTREEVYLITRIGKKSYLRSRLWASFFTTAVVFFIPFLLEIVLYAVSFPMKAKNDFFHLGLYEPEYAQMVHRYLGSSLYVYSPVLYAVIMSLFFGLLSGMLGVIPVAVSLAFPVRFRVFLFLPVYLLLNATSYIQTIRRGGITCNWYDYMLLFQDEPKNIWFLVIGIGIVLVLIIGLSFAGRKREAW
ncbi:MAG: hypothetical protein HDR21_00675 [Lachnospiraceae bacterium]|nr:hypothetical protein [Lachnospiraceae bacterium]